jgi:hypothetical protein
VDLDDGVIHARLWASSVEFTATPEAESWLLCLQWPMRATPALCADWARTHPDVLMDIHKGETRVSMRVAPGDAAALQIWAVTAEAAVAALIRLRRAQRRLGEGM